MTKHDIHVFTARARLTDPSTSQWAAETVRTRRQMQHLINSMKALTEHYYSDRGFTDRDIYDENALYHKDTEQGLRSRRADAVKLGLVKMADRKGLSPTGRPCKRWALTPKGHDVAHLLLVEATKFYEESQK